MNTSVIEKVSTPPTKPGVDITMMIGFATLTFLFVRYVFNVLPEVRNMSSGEFVSSTPREFIEKKIDKIDTDMQAFNQ